MRLQTFFSEIQFRTTFIHSVFWCNTYFWQRRALKWIYFPMFVHIIVVLLQHLSQWHHDETSTGFPCLFSSEWAHLIFYKPWESNGHIISWPAMAHIRASFRDVFKKYTRGGGDFVIFLFKKNFICWKIRSQL